MRLDLNSFLFWQEMLEIKRHHGDAHNGHPRRAGHAGRARHTGHAQAWRQGSSRGGERGAKI